MFSDGGRRSWKNLGWCFLRQEIVGAAGYQYNDYQAEGNRSSYRYQPVRMRFFRYNEVSVEHFHIAYTDYNLWNRFIPIFTNIFRRNPMENQKKFHPIWTIIIVIIVAIFIFSLVILWAVRDMTFRAVSPLTNASQALSTQVSGFLNPTPTIIPDPVTIIQEVRSLARLETIQYSIEKVIRAEIRQNELSFLFGDKLLFVAHGYVIAGVDLTKIESNDLWIKDGALFVRLPEAEVFVATLDNDKSYVYDRDTGILTKGDFTLETQARQTAEEEILSAAIDDGILEQAKINAENYLKQLFTVLGYNEVVFSE